MIITSEKATQKAIIRPFRSVHHTSFLWALCQDPVRSTTHRFVAVSGVGLPFLEISATSPEDARPAPPYGQPVSNIILPQTPLESGRLCLAYRPPSHPSSRNSASSLSDCALHLTHFTAATVRVGAFVYGVQDSEG